jgi:hypothetical protein
MYTAEVCAQTTTFLLHLFLLTDSWDVRTSVICRLAANFSTSTCKGMRADILSFASSLVPFLPRMIHCCVLGRFEPKD